MRRIVYGFLGIFGIGIGIALIAPFLLNMNAYKPQILMQAQKTLGREVTIEGDISLSLFPIPEISFKQVRVGSLPGGNSPHILQIQRLRISAKLLPLLKKEIHLKTIELDQPEIFLEKLEDGRVNWTFSSQARPSGSPLETKSESYNPPSAFNIAFDKIKIKKGHLTYLNAGQRTTFQDINAKVTLASFQGPYTLEGDTKAFDQNIKFEGAFGALQDSTEGSLKIRLGNAAATLKGLVSLPTLTFKGNLEATIDPEFMRKVLPSARTLPFYSEPLQIHSSVTGNPESISFVPVKLEMPSAHSTGEIKIFLTEGIRIQSHFTDLPGKGKCQLTAAPTNQGWTGKIYVTIGNSKTFLTWLGLETTSIPPKALGAFGLQGKYTFGNEVLLEDFMFMIQDVSWHGSLSWQSPLTLKVDFKTQTIGPLAKLLGHQASLPFETGHIQGSLSGDLNTLKLDTKLNLDDLGFSFTGVFSPTAPIPTFDGQATLGHPSFTNFLEGTMKSKGTIKTDALSIHTHLHGNTQQFNLAQIKGKLGSNTQLSGDATIDRTQQKPKIKMNLSTTALNIDALGVPLAVGQASSQLTPPQKKGHAHSPWSSDPLNFQFLNDIEALISFSTPQLIWHEMVISNPKLSATIQKGRLELTSLAGNLFGGTLNLTGHLTAENALHAHLTVKDANLSKIFTHGTTIKIIAGKLSLSSNLSAHGKSLEDMVHHLSGPLLITAKEGVMSGFDLRAISQRLNNLNNLQSLLGLFNTNMQKGHTSFSSFKGDIAFTKGIGTIQSMNLVADGGQGSATGHIDLPAYTLGVRTEFHLTDHPKLPAFRMHLTGPLDNPARHLDTLAIEKYMMENVFKNIIGKIGKGNLNAGDVIGSLLGKDKPANKDGQPSSPQQPKSDAPHSPEKIVKGILKGIF